MKNKHQPHTARPLDLPGSADQAPHHLNYCGVRRALDAIGGKWKLLIVGLLLSEPKRYSELRALLPEATEQTISRELRALEADGIVARTVTPQKPIRVDYSLTSLGMEMQPMLLALREWGDKLMEG